MTDPVEAARERLTRSLRLAPWPERGDIEEQLDAYKTEVRAARDAEVRALEYAARNVVAAWKIPNVANAMAFDGLVEALRAILDADTPS